ncbi:DUF2871 domain-containing protein [Peptoniphilus sp. oral taxon 386]|uniref:DUF2871 domain-containing protein n=1 Tax=Peptoniphilus sp. oral taxon 386 TaxID=652713 RepID=UPI0001DA9DEB|nr:DUF2871 domain-containing protein [Peptoniphilus sp. oral taxon 386]EFI41454.1 hypothetical protein HMPREF0629_00073 [Peptoniphilus sp. oral taxon 386 str. F0131]
MKKYLNFSLIYAIIAMIGGIFYREVTKWNEFSGVTVLGKVHTHLFLLGMMLFLIVALFAENNNLHEQKSFNIFIYVYNIGVAITVVMMVVRGVLQVLNILLSSKVDAAISGIAGIGHILVGVGIILLLVALKNSKRLKNLYEKMS